MADVRSEGARSVAAREIIGSLILTGDHNQVFQGDYARLGEVYIDHASVFARLDVEHFIGRDALIRDIDDFIAREPSGYIVIEAEPGLGKSALLGALVRRRGYIHHFVELTPGPQGISLALKSLAAQVARAYDLNPFGLIPTTAAAQPQYFQSLLGQASARAQAKDERVVVVIDGLDQAAAPEGHNVLGLPTSLPNGVFLIVSHQPTAIALRAPEVRRLVRTLTAQSKENLDDMRHYLEAAADRLGVPRYGFVEPLLRKCDGRWQQMVLIVREIASGARSPSEPDTIPNGLTQEYCARYRRYADSMPADRWTGIHRPLLATIAAAEEPVSIETMSAWLERTVTGSDLAPMLRGGRHSLLVLDHQKHVSRYRLEHVSARDFLHGRVDRNALASSELATLDEAVEATRAAHDRLASFYLRRFDASTRDENNALDDYGLTHIITHLEQANRHADAIALFSRERIAQQRVRARAVSWLPVKSWTTVDTRHHLWTELRTQRGTWVDVASDVTRLWTIEDQRLDQLPAPNLRAPLRFALLHSSMMGRINAITPTLASELVRLGVWSPQQSLAFGLTTQAGRWNRDVLLTALGEALAARGHVDEALAAVYMIDVGVDQAKALSKIVKLLPDRLTDALLDRLRLLLELPMDLMTGLRAEVERSPYGVASIPGDVVTGLAPGFSADAAAQAIDIVRPLPPLSRVFAWAPLFERLTPAARAALIDEALATAQSINDEHERMLALARLAADLPDDDRRRTVDNVVAAIEGEQDVGRRSALIDLVRSALLRTWPPERVYALLERAPSVDEQLTAILQRENHPDRYFVRAAVERARAGSSFGRWQVLAAASPYLEPDERDEALALARDEQFDWLGLDLIEPLPDANRFTSQQWIIEKLRERARAMNTNAPLSYLARLAALGRVDTALALTRSIGHAHARGQTLAELVRYVPADQQRPLLDEALSLVCSTQDQEQRNAIEAACEAERGQSRQALMLLTNSRVHMNSEFLADLADRLVDRGEPELAIEALIATSDFLNTRLEGFSRIADRIPEPLLSRALTAWHDERDRRNTLTAQTIVAAHATGDGAADALNARLDALFAIEDAAERAQALTLVIRHLPTSHIAPVLDRVLTTSDGTRVPLVNVSAALVAALVPRLSDATSLRRLLHTVWGSPEIEHRYKSAAIVAMRLIEQEHPRELESLAAAVGTLRTQRQVLDRMALFITDETVLELFATRESWIHDSDWAPAIADLAAFFARRGQSGVAVALVHAIDTRYRTNSALALVGVLPGGEFAVFWKAILRDVCENADWMKRPAQLRALVPVLRQFPATTLDLVLRATLHELALRPRDAFLKDLRALLPIVAAVGGDDALQAIIQGCADVGRWFP